MANLLYNLAQPFSDTKQYTQGAIVIYNDRMYEMTADEYTPGPFDPEKFTERFLSEMISGKLNSNLGANKFENLVIARGTKDTTWTPAFNLKQLGIDISKLTVDNVAIQYTRLYFGSGVRDVNSSYVKNIDSNNWLYLPTTDWCATPWIADVYTNVTKIASNVQCNENTGSVSAFTFNVPNVSSIDDIVIELNSTAIGSGESDKLINLFYSYADGIVTITPSITIWFNYKWTINVYRRN